MSGTDLTDIGQLIADYRRGVVPDQIAVVAKVLNVAVRTSNGRQRVEVVLGDRRDQLRVAFFGKPQLVRYWSDLLSSSDRGLFAGKLGWFRDQPQLAHPAFVMLMPDGRLVGTLDNMAMAKQVRKASFLGIYPHGPGLSPNAWSWPSNGLRACPMPCPSGFGRRPTCWTSRPPAGRCTSLNPEISTQRESDV